MTARDRLAVLVVLAGALPVAGARADVQIREPSTFTVDESDVIALVGFRGAAGTGPFTNAAPPTVFLEVRQALKGCRDGEIVEVDGWQGTNDIIRASNGRRFPAQEIEEMEAGWRAETVVLPRPGTALLVFLRRAGGRLVPYFDGWSRRIGLVSPSPPAVAQVAGMLWWELEVDGDWEDVLGFGAAALLEGRLTNHSSRERTFDPASMTLSGQATGRQLREVAARQGGAAKLTLRPGETREVAWDLDKLFPLSLANPGQYRFEIDVPARVQNANVVRFAFVRSGTPTLETTVVGSPIVFIARAGRQIGGGVELSQREILKSDGSEHEIPLTAPWPQDRFAIPAEGTRIIVCATRSSIELVVPLTAANREVAKRLTASGP